MLKKYFTSETRFAFSILLAATILLCTAVDTRLQIAEMQQIAEQFSIIPQKQPGTVWCTDAGDILFLNQSDRLGQDAITTRIYQNDTVIHCELVMIDSGYFDLRVKDSDPIEVLLGGKYYMDDEATLRLEPSNTSVPILQGRSRLILKRYFIEEDDCPFVHIRYN